MFLASGNSVNAQSNTTKSQNTNRTQSPHLTRHNSELFPSTVQYTKSSQDNDTFLLIAIGILILINLTYFLCQFLNPGIRNPSSIE